MLYCINLKPILLEALMFKLSPVMLLLSAALPYTAIANQVSGTVLDKNNQPVA